MFTIWIHKHNLYNRQDDDEDSDQNDNESWFPLWLLRGIESPLFEWSCARKEESRKNNESGLIYTGTF